MEKKIFLPIEIKRRELASRIYLSLVAAQKGYSSIIGHKSHILKFQYHCMDSNILIKSLPKKDIDYLKKLKKLNNNIYYIHEEGLMSFNDEYAHRMINIDALNIVDKAFVWGNNHMSAMKKIFKRNDNYLVEAGNPRIDVLFQLKKFFQAEANQIKKKFGNFILVATKFGKVNFFPRDDKNFNYIDNQINKGHIRNKYMELLGRKSVEHEKKNLFLFLDFLKKYSKLKKKNIVVRPHPNENIEFWKKELMDFDNIKIVQDHQSTNSWILASEFLISNNCTTSLEGFLLSKTCVNFNPFQDQEIEYQIPKIVSTNICDIDEMINFCNNFKENKDINNVKIIDKISDYISNVQNFNSSKKIVDTFESNKIDAKTSNYFSVLRDMLIYLKNIKRKLFSKSTFMKNLTDKKFSNISISEVKELVKYIDDINKYKITMFKPGLIKIKIK